MGARMEQPVPLSPQMQLGILIQWRQAHSIGFWALEARLREDLLSMGLDVGMLPPDAFWRLDCLAHSPGFTGASSSGNHTYGGVWAPASERVVRRPSMLHSRADAPSQHAAAPRPTRVRGNRGAPYRPSPYCLWSSAEAPYDHSAHIARFRWSHDAAQTAPLPLEVGVCRDGRVCISCHFDGPHRLATPSLFH